MTKLMEKLHLLGVPVESPAGEMQEYEATLRLNRRIRKAEAALAELLGPGEPIWLSSWGENGAAEVVRNGGGVFVDGRTDGPERLLFSVKTASNTDEIEIELRQLGGASTTVWLTEEAARQLGSALLAGARTPGGPVAAGKAGRYS